MWNDGLHKIQEWEKNHGLLTPWELLKLLAIADVEVGQSFAITEPFGDCDASETEQWSMRNDGSCKIQE